MSSGRTQPWNYSAKPGSGNPTSAIDLRQVLGILGLSGGLEEDGEVWHPCPLPFGNHEHGDRNPSFSVNITETDKKGLWSCFVCGGGNLVQLVSIMRDLDYRDAEEWLLSTIDWDESVDEFARRIQRMLDSDQESDILDEEFREYKMDYNLTLDHPWFEENGISREAAERFGLGYKPNTNGIIIPHTVDGKYVGWQQRLLGPKAKSKYINTPSFPKGTTLFNHDIVERLYRAAVVVEGPKTVVKLWGLGQKNVVATFGASVTDEQVSLLRDYDKVYLWFDNDSAGQQATNSVAERLHEYTSIYLVPPVEGDKGDPGDLDSYEDVKGYLDRSESLLGIILDARRG